MEIILRERELFREVAGLDLRIENQDFNQHTQLKLLLDTARMLEETLRQSVDLKLEAAAAKTLAGKKSTKVSVRTPQTRLNFAERQFRALRKICLHTPGLPALLECEKRYHRNVNKKRWNVRWGLDLSHMQKKRSEHAEFLDFIDFYDAIEKAEQLKILSRWLGLKELKHKVNIYALTADEMQPIVAWQILRSMAEIGSSGASCPLVKGVNYAFVFHEYACNPEQAYTIIDLAKADRISSAVVLLNDIDLAGPTQCGGYRGHR
jgi:hypothetical protein